MSCSQIAVEDSVVFLSGASRGIGRAMAVALARAGATVFLVARNSADLEVTADECKRVRPSVRVKCCAIDVTDDRALQEAVALCVNTFGTVHSCVHNVGLNEQVAITGDLSQWDRVFDVNLRSVVHLTKYLLPHMLQGGGAFVFLSSMLAKTFPMVPGHSPYITAKCAITGFADSLFCEVREYNVRVTTLYPGLVHTEMGAGFKHEYGALADRNMTGMDLLQPADVADAMLFALRPGNACVTEIVLNPQRDVFRQSVFRDNDALIQAMNAPPNAPVARRVALVTGASRGIGKAVMCELARDGYCVVGIARKREDLDILEGACRDVNPDVEVITFAIDVADGDAVQRAVDTAVARFGGLSVVVSNVGVNRRRSALTADPDIWNAVVQTNLLSAMRLTRIVLPHLVKNANNSRKFGGSGASSSALIFINTMYAVPKQMNVPGVAVYAASKKGLAGFADVVLQDVRDCYVKVCTIYPGLVNTDMGTAPGPIERAALRGTKPIETPSAHALRMIQPLDMANAVRYVVQSPPTACPNEVVVNSMTHDITLIRREAQRFMEAHSGIPGLRPSSAL